MSAVWLFSNTGDCQSRRRTEKPSDCDKVSIAENNPNTMASVWLDRWRWHNREREEISARHRVALGQCDVALLSREETTSSEMFAMLAFVAEIISFWFWTSGVVVVCCGHCHLSAWFIQGSLVQKQSVSGKTRPPQDNPSERTWMFWRFFKFLCRW